MMRSSLATMISALVILLALRVTLGRNPLGPAGAGSR